MVVSLAPQVLPLPAVHLQMVTDHTNPLLHLSNTEIRQPTAAPVA